MKIKKLNESISPSHSSRYNTYKKRIEKAIANNDVELLKRTKEAIMYAPSKELKNSEAEELWNMIKGAKLQESSSEYDIRRKNYERAKTDFEKYGEEDNNDVLSREEKMHIAKAELDKAARNESVRIFGAKGKQLKSQFSESTNTNALGKDAHNEKVTLYYDDLEVQIGHGDGSGYYDRRSGCWLPDGDDRVIEIDYEYDVDKDDVIDHIDYLIYKEDPNFIDKFETDEEYYKYLEDNFDELFDKYEEKILDKFRDAATDHAQEHGDFDESLKEASTSNNILYVIKDKHGNQLSNPNPDDNELWDRVESMEAHGRKGLSVVAYVNKPKGPYIRLSDPQAYVDELDFAGAVEINGDKVYADEETLRQLANAILAEYGWNVKINEGLNEASYGGAFDIADDQYFTKEELVEFGEDVVDNLNSLAYSKAELESIFIENNVIEITITWDGNEITVEQPIDMRRIRTPKDLDKYRVPVISKMKPELEELGFDFGPHLGDYELSESSCIKNEPQPVAEAYEGVYSDKFRALAKKYYEDAPTEDALLVLINDIIRYCPEDDLKDLWVKYSKRYEKDLEESLDTDTAPAEDINAGMSSVISSLIKDEYEAIDGYNSAIATALAEGHTDVANVLVEIQAEENVHVGQLQEVMKMFDPNADKVEDGAAEAEEQLSNPLS